MYAKDCTNDEFRVFCQMADNLGLNPALHQIWAIKYPGGGPATIIVGRDGLMDVAHRDGNFDGIESGTEGTIKEGNLTGWCKVYRKDMSHPFSVIVRYDEYVNRKPTGEITKFWAKMPHTMIQKVAQAQALRQAFRVTGVYCEDEMPAPEPREVQDTSRPAVSANPTNNPNKCVKCGNDINPDNIEMILAHTNGVPMCDPCFSPWYREQLAEKSKAIAPPETKPVSTPEHEPEPVTLVMCAECGNGVEPGYVEFSREKAGKALCQACFEAWAQAPKAKPATPKPKNTCQSCGKEIPLGTTHCLDCVSATHGKPPERAPKKKPEPVQEPPAPVKTDGPACVHCGAALTKKELIMSEKFVGELICGVCLAKKQRGEL
jgi:phage recombination protein Bet